MHASRRSPYSVGQASKVGGSLEDDRRAGLSLAPRLHPIPTRRVSALTGSTPKLKLRILSSYKSAGNGWLQW